MRGGWRGGGVNCCLKKDAAATHLLAESYSYVLSSYSLLLMIYGVTLVFLRTHVTYVILTLDSCYSR